MRKLPTTITTKEGAALKVSIKKTSRDLHGNWRTSIEFHHKKGALCSSYYTETFMAIPDNQGLCLEGMPHEYQSINSDQVTICKMLIKSYELASKHYVLND